MVVWMHDEPAREGKSYLIKQTTNVVPGVLTDVRYQMDVNELHRLPGKVDALGLNEVGRVHLTLHRPLAFDSYRKNRATGAFVLIDRLSNVTVGAGMIVDRPVGKKDAGPKSKNISLTRSEVTRASREALLGQQGHTLWLTGLSGSGKSTIAAALERRLTESGRLCCLLDGDNVRHGLNRDLGFSHEDRTENIRRIAEVARLMNDTGVIVIAAFISPYAEDRRSAREIVGTEHFSEVFVDAPLDVCEDRDPKGLYARVRAGEIHQFTGITDPYEVPVEPEVHLRTAEQDVDAGVAQVLAALKERGVIPG
jgi:bifunctional enzyme CysN/CysC